MTKSCRAPRMVHTAPAVIGEECPPQVKDCKKNVRHWRVCNSEELCYVTCFKQFIARQRLRTCCL
jgi:hypothetical protein